MAIANIQEVQLAPLSNSSKIIPLNSHAAPADSADVAIYNGADPDAFMAAILKMIEAVQAAETNITKTMAANSTLQKSMGDQFLKAIIAEGNEMLAKIKAQEEAAEEAAEKSRIGGILGIVAAAVMALVTVASCGVAAGLLAITMTVMMALPQDKNPLELGSKEFGKLTGSQFGGEILMIVAVAAAIMICGGAASATGLFEDSADAAAQDGVADGAAKRTVMGTTKSIAADVTAQTSLILNPLGTGATWIAKKSGYKNDGLSITLECIAVVVTVAAGIALCKGYSTEGGSNLFSNEAITTIRSAGRNLSAAFGIASGGFAIAAGTATQKQADALSDQADAQGSYTLFEGLMKTLQGNIQISDKEQQAVTKEFQSLGKNFAHLADPFKFMANASGVLA